MKKTVKRVLSICVIAILLTAMISSAIPVAAAEDYFRNPQEAVYESFGEIGYARGQLTVKVDNWVNTDSCPMEAVAFWANANGVLEGYSPLARFTLSTRSTTFEFPELQIIPKEADRLRVYTAEKGKSTLSATYADAMLPEGYGYNLPDTPLMSFVVVSDTHLRADDSALANQRFKDMLNDVKNDFSGVKGIFVNGDNINAAGISGSDTQAAEDQFAVLEEYMDDICPEIPLYMAVGNHDMWPNAAQDSVKDMFLNIATLPDGTHPESLNYDFWLGGYHFVFLGDDDRDGNYASFDRKTLQWIDETIGDGYDDDTPTFLFLHQALSNTVAGSLTNYGQTSDGVVNVVELRNILRKYPRAILFSGHSHYSMNSVQNAYSGGSMFPTTFNTASLADVYIDEDQAQGYIIEVYEKAVLVRGRDFAADEWIASAQYAVDYGAELEPAPEIPASKPTDTPTEAPTDSTAQPDANATDATDGEGDADGAEKSGCGAVIGTGTVAIALLPIAFCQFRRRKKE